MATLAAFMPNVPGMPEPEDHSALGMKIKHLVEEGKIRLDGIDKNWNIKIIHMWI